MDKFSCSLDDDSGNGAFRTTHEVLEVLSCNDDKLTAHGAGHCCSLLLNGSDFRE